LLVLPFHGGDGSPGLISAVDRLDSLRSQGLRKFLELLALSRSCRFGFLVLARSHALDFIDCLQVQFVEHFKIVVGYCTSQYVLHLAIKAVLLIDTIPVPDLLPEELALDLVSLLFHHYVVLANVEVLSLKHVQVALDFFQSHSILRLHLLLLSLHSVELLLDLVFFQELFSHFLFKLFLLFLL